MIKHDQLERWVFFNLQVQMASPSPSLSRWRRWEEPCGCWATWTDRLVFFRSELVFFFATVPRCFLQQFPGFFRLGGVCKFPVMFLQWFRPVFYCIGWLVVVVVVSWLQNTLATCAKSTEPRQPHVSIHHPDHWCLGLNTFFLENHRKHPLKLKFIIIFHPRKT